MIKNNIGTSRGWNEEERKGFKTRAKFDAVIALAFEHHLAIAKNIPLDQAVKWLIDLAPRGLIEFIPKNDKTIKKMLTLKLQFEHVIFERVPELFYIFLTNDVSWLKETITK